MLFALFRGNARLPVPVRRTRLLIAAACWTVPLAAAVGCSGGAGSGGGAAAKPVTPITKSEESLLGRAELVLTGRCMREHGFRFVSDGPSAGSTESGGRHFTFGVDDVAWAEKHGFGDSDERAGGQPLAGNPNARYLQSLPLARQSAFMRTLYGDEKAPRVAVTLPSGPTVSASVEGCQAEAQKKLYGDFRNWFYAKTIAVNLSAEIRPRVFGDPRFQERERQWARCMKKAGHPADNAGALRKTFLARKKGLTGSAASRLEKTLAVAEARCVLATHLNQVGREVQAEHSEEVNKKHAGTVNTYQRLRRAALPAARALVRD
ncbi:hypothetical protein RKE29_18420 [Streptomyces sp. B1866]|uniref:hypothetical protein n=1 Tax=Streptomyces sp. B1866 TaxID=3075431 RepID=UPI00288DDC7B|nr:hypothetical protein [Streptomyces sp. B1866]MDT3398597.1 hypothetical protein [Streptomyces sp. B1866]